MCLAWTAQPRLQGGPDVPVCFFCLKIITRLHKSGFQFTAELSRRCRDASSARPCLLHREPPHQSGRLSRLMRPRLRAVRLNPESMVRSVPSRCGTFCGSGRVCSDAGPPSLWKACAGPLPRALAPSLVALVFHRLRSFASPERAPVGAMQRVDFSDELLLPTGELLSSLCVFSWLDICCGF